MRTEAEIQEQIAKLVPATLGEISQDRETARNLVHTLTWILNDDPPGITTTPPSELLGYVTMQFTPEALIAFRPEPKDSCPACLSEDPKLYGSGVNPCADHWHRKTAEI